MNINIKWLKRRTKKVEDKFKMDAYLRTYSSDAKSIVGRITT